MNYQIFTDATADMNDAMLAEFPIRMISMNVNLGDRDYVYGPDGNLDIQDFYAQQRNGKFASTSQISPSTYLEQFTPVLEAGTDILYLCFSSGLSETYSAAQLTARDLAGAFPARRIVVIDTLCAAVGEGLLVYEAARKQAAGWSMDELIAWVEAHRLEVCHWFTVDTFDHLRHGGRVSGATAAVGSLLNIKPLLHVDAAGKLETMAKPRGRRQAMTQQLAHMQNGWKPELGNFVLIGHGDVPEEAENLKAAVLEMHPEAEVQTAWIGPVIGAHTGPGMLALIFWGSER